MFNFKIKRKCGSPCLISLKCGFTLVELLVVISIIALLLSILMPSLQKARESAKRVVCQGHLRQVSLGTQMYTMENHSKFPLMGTISFSKGQKNPYDHWDKLIYPYINNSKVFHCPSERIETKDSQKGLILITYGYNTLLAGNNFGPTNNPPSFKTTEVKIPGSVMLHMDINMQDSSRTLGLGHTFADRFWVASKNYCYYNLFDLRHGGGDNISFVDGHVKWYETKTLNNLGDDNIYTFEYLDVTWNGITFWLWGAINHPKR